MVCVVFKVEIEWIWTAGHFAHRRKRRPRNSRSDWAAWSSRRKGISGPKRAQGAKRYRDLRRCASLMCIQVRLVTKETRVCMIHVQMHSLTGLGGNGAPGPQGSTGPSGPTRVHLTACYTGYTSCEQLDRVTAEYLDRLKPACAAGYLMTEFGIKRNSCSGVNSHQYQFRCCKLEPF